MARAMKDSGIQWIGQIPENWIPSKIKFVATIHNGDRGSNYPSGDDMVDDGIYFITTNNIDGIKLNCNKDISKFITEERYNLLGGAKIELNDIIYCLRGSIGKCAINKNISQGTIASSLTCLRVKKAIPDYINYFLQSNIVLDQVKLFMNGTCAANLSAENVANFFLLEPPLTEQTRIANFLDQKCSAIDSVLEKTRASIEEYKKLKQSVITQAVTKGIRGNRPMKDSGVQWIGQIPEDWDSRRLKSLFTFGKGLPITKENLVETGLPVISYGQIHSKTNSGVRLQDDLIRFVPDTYLSSNPEALVHKGDYIFADTSEDLEGCGNCVYVDEEKVLFAGYHTIIFKRKTELESKYLAYLFKTDSWRNQIRSKCFGVKLFSITQKILGSVSVILPSEKEQKEIVSHLDNICTEIDGIIAKKTSLLSEIEAYKKSLIYEYVTGKKEVA